MSSPLVSIIVPIFKVEPYLRRCLDSVVNQTYTNLEIILVDDGSPDNCPQICDEYAAKDKRIVVIHKENGGLSDARNTGLDICKGEYISFVDSDDWVDERYIEILLNAAKNECADIAIGEIKKVSIFESSAVANVDYFESYKPNDAIKRLLGRTEASFVAAWGKLFKANIFVKLRFPIGKIHEDEYVNYIWFYKAQKIVYTKTVLYFYFCRPDSIMGQSLPYNYEEIFKLQYIFFQHLNSNDILNILIIRYGWTLLSFFNKGHQWKNKRKLLQLQIKQYKKDFLPHCTSLSFNDLALRLFVFFPKIYIFYKKMQSKLRFSP